MGIFGKDKNKLMLVFDIGSSSVGAAFFLTQGSGVPKILFTVREQVPLRNTLDISEFLSSAVESLSIVVDKAYGAKMGKPDSIFCVLSSPWHVSQTRVIRLEKNAPFIFNSKLADSLIQKEISLFEEEYVKKYLDAESPVRSIEFKNIKTMLNGYESPAPLNQKVKEVEMTIFISISPEQVLKQIEETIGKSFHFKSIKFSSSALASFALVRDMYGHSDNFLLIDIGGEVTDISMAKRNILRESISFPLGMNFIIRGVAGALNVTLPEARSLVSLYKDGHAGGEVEEKLGSAMTALKLDWQKKFQDSLANISNDISVPATIYLSVEKDMSDLFSEVIKTEQFNQYTLTESKFEIILLNTEAFHGLVEFENNAVRDLGLIMDSLYINRFLTHI